MKQLLPENNGSNGSNGHNSPMLAPADYTSVEAVASQPASASAFKVQKFFTFLLKYWPIPLVTLVLGAGGGLAYVLSQPPTYVSHAQLWETVRLRLPEGTLFSEDTQNFLGTQTELLESGKLHELAIDRIKTLSTNAIPLGKDGQPLSVTLSVSASAKSSVFTVVGASSDPAYVQAFVDALANEYIEYKKDVKKTISGDTVASITEQVLRQEATLKTEQEALSTYEKTNNLFVLQEQAKIAGTYLASLNTQLSDEELELHFLQAKKAEDSLPAGQAPSQSDAVKSAMPSGQVDGAQGQPPSTEAELEMLKFERARLSKNLRPKHPKIVVLDEEIAKSEKLVEILRNKSQQQLDTQRAGLEVNIAGRKAAIKMWEGKVAEENALMAEAERLQRNVSRVQVLYDRLVGLLNNVDISRNIDQDTLAILAHATPAERSYEAEIGMMTKCTMGGLFAGVAIVFLIALRDDKFASSTDINEKFGDVIVGQVPDVRGGRKKAPLALVQDNDDRHMYAESYRNLRSAILFLTTDGSRPKLILVTSAVPNEGKSTIASNLARIMAVGGARVMLIDGDMRRGALHETFGLQQEPGLTDLLRRQYTVDGVVQTGKVPNLSFIGRGGNVNNPGDLLLGPELDKLLADVRQRYDYVVVDSCPVFAADDVTALAPKLDGTLFVVRSQFSRAKLVQEALDLLYQRGARVLGLVFNRAKSSSRTGYGYYKYADYHQGTKDR